MGPTDGGDRMMKWELYVTLLKFKSTYVAERLVDAVALFGLYHENVAVSFDRELIVGGKNFVLQ